MDDERQSVYSGVDMCLLLLLLAGDKRYLTTHSLTYLTIDHS